MSVVELHPDPGEAGKQEGMERAIRHANAEWALLARLVISGLALGDADFTADDVWAALDQPKLPTTPERRAMGVLIREAVAAKMIASTDTWRRSRRPECHKRPVAVWRPIWRETLEAGK